MNRYSAFSRYEAMQAATFLAAQWAFPHLSLADVIEPPHVWFDAALARQIAQHVLIRHFGQPKRRVCEEQGRRRERINHALNTIDDRLEDPTFAARYREIVAKAEDIYSAKWKAAA